MTRVDLRTLLAISAACSALGCTSTRVDLPGPSVESSIRHLMREYGAASVGIGLIRRDELVWTAYYGERAPGQPVDSETLFNAASCNKAVTAELALRLASRGRIDLDEPIAAHYEHPDLARDPRYAVLTPRVLLTHQAGLRNWPYLYDDGKLAFVGQPGSGAYHYSGAGFRIFARFLEAKLGAEFPDLVQREVFTPLGMKRTTNSHDRARDLAKVVVPVNAEGAFRPGFEFEAGYWSAADDLFVTVEDFARFLIATRRGLGVSAAMARERVRVQTRLAAHPIWKAGPDLVDPCPEPYGHGIAWFVFGYPRGLVVHHGGNDKSEAAIGYFEPATGDGGVILVNCARGIELWPKIVDLVDPAQRFQNVFHDLIRVHITKSSGGAGS